MRSSSYRWQVSLLGYVRVWHIPIISWFANIRWIYGNFCFVVAVETTVRSFITDIKRSWFQVCVRSLCKQYTAVFSILICKGYFRTLINVYVSPALIYGNGDPSFSIHAMLWLLLLLLLLFCVGNDSFNLLLLARAVFVISFPLWCYMCCVAHTVFSLLVVILLAAFLLIPHSIIWLQWYVCSYWLFSCNDRALLARCPRHIQSVLNLIVDILMDTHVVVNWQLSKRVSIDQCHLTVSRAQVYNLLRWRVF